MKVSKTDENPVVSTSKQKQTYAFLTGDNSMFEEGRNEEKAELDGVFIHEKKTTLNKDFREMKSFFENVKF